MIIVDYFGDLANIIRPDKTIIDNIVFQLHSKVTVVLLLTCALTVSFVQYFGTPIDCVSDFRKYHREFLNTHCWISTTYSIPSLWDQQVGEDVVYPGVGNSPVDKRDRVYHAYYQWVWFVLFIQAVSFSITKFVWKIAEGKKTSSLIQGLDQHLLPKDKQEETCERVAKYLIRSRGCHSGSFFTYFSLEVFNAINIIAQMFITDRLLGGKFWSLGFHFLEQRLPSPDEDPLVVTALLRVFPRMTKCTFHQTGPSGDTQKQDAFCLLAVNHVNEKVFIVLWFWFVFIMICSMAAVIYRTLTWISLDIRTTVIKQRCPMASRSLLNQMVLRIGIGDWFLLTLLAKNMDGFNFKRLVEEYHRRTEKKCNRSSGQLNEIISAPEEDGSATFLLQNHDKVIRRIKDCRNFPCNCQQFERKEFHSI